MIDLTSSWFKITNAPCVHHHIPLLSTVAELQYILHEISYQWEWLLLPAVYHLPVLLYVWNLLNKSVTLDSPQPEITGCVILVLHIFYTTMILPLIEAPSMVEILY